MGFARIIYLILLIASVVLVSNQGGKLTYVLFFSFLLYPVLSFIHILYTRFVFRVYQDVGGHVLYKKTPVSCQISFENSGIIPIAGIRIITTDDVSEFRDPFADNRFSLAAKEKMNIDTEITCNYAGAYVAGIKEIKLTDCFGIMGLTYDIPTPLRVTVLPIVTDIAEREMSRLYAEDETGSKPYRLETHEETLGNEIRKYMEGDSMNRVHWKNYARSGKLYVRLPERQNSGLMSIAILTGEGSDTVKRDYMMEYLVSAANWFAKQKRPVRFVYKYGSGTKEWLVENYDTFQKFYMERLPETVSKSADVDENEVLEKMEAVGGSMAVYREDEGKLLRIDRKR